MSAAHIGSRMVVGLPKYDSIGAPGQRVSRFLSLAKRMVLFGGGSLAGAALDFVTTLALNALFSVPPWAALALSMSLSATVVYFYHGRVTFRGSAQRGLGHFARYMALAVSILIFRVVLLELFTAAHVTLWLALAGSIAVVSVANFFLSSRLFRGSFS